MIPLLVIRHAPTDWNAVGRLQGHTDQPLSETSRKTLQTLEPPGDWRQAQCLSSPLQRAVETATLLGLDPSQEPALIEMAWGEWEGRTLADLRAELGAAMVENEARGLDFRPAGGESPRDVQARLLPLLRGLDRATVFVTHKGVLRALYALASGWSMQGKAPNRLLSGHAHAFLIREDGMPSVDRLNVPLLRR